MASHLYGLPPAATRDVTIKICRDKSLCGLHSAISDVHNSGEADSQTATPHVVSKALVVQSPAIDSPTTPASQRRPLPPSSTDSSETPTPPSARRTAEPPTVEERKYRPVDQLRSTTRSAGQTHMIFLESVKSNASHSGSDYRYLIRFQNSLLRRALRGENYLKLYSYHYLINGFAVLITPEQVKVIHGACISYTGSQRRLFPSAPFF